MKTTDKPIVVKHSFNVPKETLWEALTHPKQMRQWFFDTIPDFKPEVGFKTRFDVKSNSRLFVHNWKILEVEPQKSIKYSWTYDGFKGKCTTCFELSHLGNATQLTLTALILEDFQDNIPEFKRESCISGWNYFIKQQLDAYLNKC